MPQKVRDQPAQHRRLRVERLEDRRLLAVLTVQNDLDDTLANLAGDGELSLREAIEIANHPGTVIDGFVSNDVEDTLEFVRPFFDEPRTILLADGELEITESLKIDGPGQELLTIDAQEQSRVINFNGIGGSFTLEGVTLTHGRTNLTGEGGSGGGLRFQSEGILRIHQSTITESAIVFGGGGGIFAEAEEVHITESIISGNKTSGDEARGGGLWAFAGALYITDSSISENRTSGDRAFGGGIFSFSNPFALVRSTIAGNRTTGDSARGGGIAASIIEISNSEVTDNRTTGDSSMGGGVWSGDITLNESVVSGNVTSGSRAGGGGVYARSISMYGSVVTNNATLGEISGGGALRSWTSGPNIFYDSVISDNNTAGHYSPGGAILVSGLSNTFTSIQNSSISGNHTSGLAAYGGGIATLSDGSLAISNSSFTENTTLGKYGAGGAIYTGTFSILTLTNSTISENKTSGQRAPGGAIYAGAIAKIGNSTVSNNYTSGAEASGGGISARNATITHSTITGNFTEDIEAVGGGVSIHAFDQADHLELQDSILAGNFVVGDGQGPDLWSTPQTTLSVSHSLIGNTSGSSIDANTGVGNLLNVDPLLGPLADNGGLTRTHALLPGSPALDAGDPSILFDPFDPDDFDQRGAPYQRLATGVLLGIPSQRIDIGAYEAQSPPSADFVDDDHVNGQDFLAWQIGFGMTEVATPADGDSDGDGDVDLSDLAAWQVSYGQTELPPPPGVAPAASSQRAGDTDYFAARLVDAVLGLMGDDEVAEHMLLIDSPSVESVARGGELARVAPASRELYGGSTLANTEASDEGRLEWLADELLQELLK